LLLGFSTRWQDYVTEFGSVIGSGFVWRQIARSLIGLIPAWGIIPKVVVAYSGTYVVGNAILSWYLTGRKLSSKQMRALSAQALTRGKEYARKLGQKIPRPRIGIRKKEKLPALQKSHALPEEIVISKISNQAQEVGSVEGMDNLMPVTDGKSEMATGGTLISKKGTAGRSRPGKRIKMNRRKQKEAANLSQVRICSQCGKASSADARFCQYCGAAFDN
jgi:ribosomal protein L32